MTENLVWRGQGPMPETAPRWGACPRCGDSLQTVTTRVPDHGTHRSLVIGWCMDCLAIKAWAVKAPSIRTRHLEFDT